MAEKTMGQALDEALTEHTERWPQSAAYRAEVYETETNDTWIVEIHASHFSRPLTYLVGKRP